MLRIDPGNLGDRSTRIAEPAAGKRDPRRPGALLDAPRAGTLLELGPARGGVVGGRAGFRGGGRSRRGVRNPCAGWQTRDVFPQRLRRQVVGIQLERPRDRRERRVAVAAVEGGTRAIQVFTKLMPPSSGLHGRTRCKRGSRRRAPPG